MFSEIPEAGAAAGRREARRCFSRGDAAIGSVHVRAGRLELRRPGTTGARP
jgi:hypothetical protein